MRSTMMEAQTMTKARSVPMLTILPILSIGVMDADDGRQQSHQDGVFPGRAEARMDGGEELLGQQTVVGHGIEHARLAEQHDQHDAGQSGQRAAGDDV